MTEAEWLAATNSEQILEFLRGKVSDRKLRLFACACGRSIWSLLNADGQKAVEMAERYADDGGRLMTEAQWLAWDDLLRDARLDFVSEKVSERKLRLFGCACCLHIRELIPDLTGLRAIELAERFADGEATSDDLVVLQTRDDYYHTPEHYPQKARCARWAAMWTAVRPFDARAAKYCGGNAAQAHSILSNAPIHDEYRSEYTDDQRSAWIVSVQLALLADIIGNPFRTVAFSPDWRTDTAVALARTMYDAREFSAMPILADALQDAGCDSDDVLNHCRGPGPHVRGCWVVDAILGKE